jgi:hypothetical protein
MSERQEAYEDLANERKIIRSCVAIGDVPDRIVTITTSARFIPSGMASPALAVLGRDGEFGVAEINTIHD